MRPAIVLSLVLAAVAALVAALFLLGDPATTERGDGVGPVPVEPSGGAPGETALQPAANRIAAPNATTPNAGTASVAAADAPGREAVGAGNFGAFANSLIVTVLDPDGQAVGGADLELREDRGGGPFAELSLLMAPDQAAAQIRKAKTDALGRHAFENLTPSSYVVAASHAAFARSEVGSIKVADSGEVSVAVALSLGIALEGRVTDTAGAPIAGATLSLIPVIFSQSPDHPNARVTTAKTDGEGLYRFERLDGGSRNLTATAQGFGARTQPNLLIVPRPEGPMVQDFTLTPGFAISGVVVGSDGRPVADAAVQALNFSATTTSTGRTRTRPDGTFDLPDLADGSYQVIASAQGWRDGRDPRVQAGTTGLRIELVELGGALGRVTSAVNGEPLTSFVLLVRRANLQNGLLGRVERRENFASKDGTYRLAGLDEGEFVVEVEAQGFAKTASERFRVEQGIFTPEIDVALTLGGTLQGRVVSAATGAPISGAKVITHDAGFVRHPLSEMFGSFTARDTTDRHARTGADGRFSLGLLAPGTYQIEVDHPEHVTQTVNNLNVADGNAPTDAGDVRLSSGGIVRGTVTDKAGKPLLGATVTLAGMEPGRVYNERTDASGRYRIRRVAMGGYRITAQRATGSGGVGNPFEVLQDVEQTKSQIFVGDNADVVQDFEIGTD